MAIQSADGFRTLTVDVEGALCVVTLNEPESLNTVTLEMHDELTRVWPVVSELEGVRCVILTGAGRAFTVGGDVKAMSDGDFVEAPAHAMFAADRNLIHRFLNVPCPVISAINGNCVGLGASLALMSDFSVMADDARIGDPHVRVGLVAGDGGVPIWPLLVGLNKAKEALLLGRLYSAAEAKTMGLVGSVCPRDEVMAEARRLAQEIASLPPLAVQWTKLSLNKVLRLALEQSFDTSVALEMLTFMSQDHSRAARAFVDKTTPDFEGR
jgi:enoyl-CoA hydratase/carnithine racemase